jgi:YqjK-like protein
LRSALAEQSVLLAAPLAVADRVHAGARWLVRHREWVAGGVVVVLVVRPRRAWRALRLGWWAWRSARRARGWLSAAGLLASAGPPPGQY